jgi:tetratricopeptide (TPR) repeat protein
MVGLTVYLHSTIKSHLSQTLEREDSMRVAALQEEDLNFLAQICTEQLRAEVPSGEFFVVKCAVQNDLLMILTQHPQGVHTETEQIFAVLEETLQSLSTPQERQVEFFLRVAGSKLPYAKHSLILKAPENTKDAPDIAKEEDTSDIGKEEDARNIGNEDLAAISVILAQTPSQTPRFSLPSPIIGVVLVLMIALGCAYVLTRPCVLHECKEIQTAQQLQKSLRQQTRSAKSEQELAEVQKQFQAVSASLKSIPFWSFHYQQVKQLSASLSSDSEQINQVIQALSAASLAVKESQNQAKSLQELETRQHLWRQAIVPLESIDSNSELYEMVQSKLTLYRTSLQAIKQQLLMEERWLKKVNSAKAVALEAQKREGAAKSLQDLQKVQFTWQVVVNALTPIPQTSFVYQEAQKLLQEYKPQLARARTRATKELMAAKTYNQAVNASTLAKRYQQQNQWVAAVTHWEQALNAAQQISHDSLYYTQTQTLIQPFSIALKEAQEKLQVANLFRKTRTDLDKTCTREIRVCNFALDNQGISVWITSEYEQTLHSSFISADEEGDENTVANLTHHLETLQDALEVISDNANLPLVVYNAQGQVIYSKM